VREKKETPPLRVGKVGERTIKSGGSKKTIFEPHTPFYGAGGAIFHFFPVKRCWGKRESVCKVTGKERVVLQRIKRNWVFTAPWSTSL